MFWNVLFMFLNHLSIQHTPNPLFLSNFLFSSLTQSLIYFKSNTVSDITNLDNSVHPFHFPSSSSSSHTPYQSAFRMLCNTIHASFSTKKCTLPHILFQLITQFRFSPFCLSATQWWLFSLFIHSSSHCCSTSSLNEIIPLFSDSIRHSESADRSVSRDASIATNRCLHPFHQENGLLITRWTVNVFDYILLVILNIKPEFWPFAMREECAESSHSSTSLFGLNLFFLYIHTRIRKILWWERCWSWVWWMWRKKWAR